MSKHSAPVFLSYAHIDKFAVEARIIDTLFDCRLWWDGGGGKHYPNHDGIPSGVPFPDEIEQAVRKCRVFIIALSPNSMDSEWCKRELELAYKAGCHLLPIWIEGPDAKTLTVKLPELAARNIQYLDLSGDITDKSTELQVALRRLGAFRRPWSWRFIAVITIALIIGTVIGLFLPAIANALFNQPPPTAQILRSLVDRESQAALSEDISEIAALYIDHAVVEDADPNGRIWGDAIAYYTQSWNSLFFCRTEHNDFQIVLIDDNYARATSSSEGAYGLHSQSPNTNNCPNTYDNPRGADIWEFVRDSLGNWRISHFTFNAHRK